MLPHEVRAARREAAQQRLNRCKVNRLLRDASIERPPELDDAALLAALNRARHHFVIGDQLKEPPVVAEDRNAIDQVVKIGRRLQAAIALLTDRPNLTRPVDHRLVRLRRSAAAADAAVAELIAAQEGAMKALAERDAEGPALPAGGGATPWNRLLGHALPAVFEEFFGRKCVFSESSSSTPASRRLSEGTRFIIAAVGLMGRGPVKPDAVEAAERRWRRATDKGSEK